ncbi:putative multidrug resistance ABC transporter ATP-binding/permease protein YheH [Jeotgalicoccus aerolatus]|uniref:ATP-binding cassette subfamily B protein n=1 Tax=Jeotgalicoccus aerolatus TaxID=709510 RepID=A0ABS4HJX3_9STAP|nr:ABC transporter ATP-binding protein [Jeotgalicoccus aerolatus]MBP1951118.1 ATP-binding cassette subfamily B protein [Jeotgalicoccus aerolatus]GGE00113.1 multidrug ABC transporter permease [Jeotgalicoccus aerolatus]CAD2078027.1 putative multidrug resistance ABC transporter ATP-binding/permease protein YheH [Jeotgalicoccus aerolatus]
MKEMLKLLPYIKQYKLMFLGGIMLMILMVGFELAGPLIAASILDNHIKLGEGNILLRPILYLIGLFLTIKLLHAVVSYFAQIVLVCAGTKAIQQMRHDVFKHVQSLPIRYFDNLPAGKVVARITNDTESILQLFASVIPMFMVSILTIFSITAIVFYVHFWTGIVMLLFIPVILIWGILYKKYSNENNHIKRERNSDMNAMINESINGMPIIQVFNREEQIRDEFEKINDEYYDSAKGLVKLESLSGENLANTIRSIVFAILVYIFAATFLSDSTALTVGVMYLLVDYITRFFNPLFNIIGQLSIFETARVAANKVFEMLESQPEEKEDGKLSSFNGNISFRNVNFSYDGKRDVLKNINIEAVQGDTVALVGHTGSGKSSIINLLMRFYDPSDGAIYFDDQNTKTIDKQNIRQFMSIVLQDPFIYSGTLMYNVRLNNENISEAEVLKALEDVGAGPLLDRLSDGIHTELAERGATLSLGERQLISFARALAFNPKVLVLDEATSNIDSETEQLIQYAMNVVSKNRTTFIIAHRLSTIQHADQIILLENGEIKEQGNHKELIALGRNYSTMYNMQMG